MRPLRRSKTLTRQGPQVPRRSQSEPKATDAVNLSACYRNCNEEIVTERHPLGADLSRTGGLSAPEDNVH